MYLMCLIYLAPRRPKMLQDRPEMEKWQTSKRFGCFHHKMSILHYVFTTFAPPPAWPVQLGLAWPPPRPGLARPGLVPGRPRPGPARLGLAVAPTRAWPPPGPSPAQPGPAWPRPGTGPARPGPAWPGLAPARPGPSQRFVFFPRATSEGFSLCSSSAGAGTFAPGKSVTHPVHGKMAPLSAILAFLS